jgi:serine/alanine adding enzyme
MKKAIFKIINKDQTDELHQLLEKCMPNDIHFSPDYLHLFSEYFSMEGFYAFYGDEEEYILVPFFKKPVPEHKTGEKYFDLISPWYYGGPVYSVKNQSVIPNLFKSWQDNFNKYCMGNNIVSEFQRLNPAIENHLLYQHDTGLSFNREIVCINLKKDLEQINSEYAYHVRKNIKTAEVAGLQLIRSKNKSDWEKFIEIYLSSMRQKEADSFYHFNNVFYTKLFSNFYDDMEIFRVELQGKTIATTLVLGKYGILHDYLRGSLGQYLSLRPNDFMIHNIISWAKEYGYSYYSLGGGHSTDPNDSLLKFKKSFSPDGKGFYIYKKIHNLEKYRQLFLVAGQKEDRLAYEKASFFPEYFKP